MQLSEDKTLQKYGKHCGHCNQKTLLQYKCEWTCFSCGYNASKLKHERTKIQRKKRYFINILKYAEQKKTFYSHRSV